VLSELCLGGQSIKRVSAPAVCGNGCYSIVNGHRAVSRGT